MDFGYFANCQSSLRFDNCWQKVHYVSHRQQLHQAGFPSSTRRHRQEAKRDGLPQRRFIQPHSGVSSVERDEVDKSSTKYKLSQQWASSELKFLLDGGENS